MWFSVWAHFGLSSASIQSTPNLMSFSRLSEPEEVNLKFPFKSMPSTWVPRIAQTGKVTEGLWIWFCSTRLGDSTQALEVPSKKCLVTSGWGWKFVLTAFRAWWFSSTVSPDKRRHRRATSCSRCRRRPTTSKASTTTSTTPAAAATAAAMARGGRASRARPSCSCWPSTRSPSRCSSSSSTTWSTSQVI